MNHLLLLQAKYEHILQVLKTINEIYYAEYEPLQRRAMNLHALGSRTLKGGMMCT